MKRILILSLLTALGACTSPYYGGAYVEGYPAGGYYTSPGYSTYYPGSAYIGHQGYRRHYHSGWHNQNGIGGRIEPPELPPNNSNGYGASGFGGENHLERQSNGPIQGGALGGWERVPR